MHQSFEKTHSRYRKMPKGITKRRKILGGCYKGLLYACTLSSYGMFVQKPRMKVETSILGVSSYNEEKIKNR